MDITLKSQLTQFWFHVRGGLFPLLTEMGEELTPPLKQVATVLEMIEIERFVPDSRGVGRKPRDWVALARAFVQGQVELADNGSADGSPQG